MISIIITIHVGAADHHARQRSAPAVHARSRATANQLGASRDTRGRGLFYQSCRKDDNMAGP